MAIQVFKKVFSFALTRVLMLYVVTAVVLNFTVDIKHAMTVASFRTLNRLMPPHLHALNDVVADRKNIDRKSLRNYQFYFEKVTELMPQMADAYGIVGFCSYYLGKHDKAVKAYQKGIELNPAFFWFYHNLGFIYFKGGQYEDAVAMFEAALNTKPEHVVLFIRSSTRIYIPILFNNAGRMDEFVRNQLRQGFYQVYLALISNQITLKNYPMVLKNAMHAISNQMDENGIFYYYAGMAAYELRDYQKAAVLLEEAIKRKKEFAEAYQYLGLTIRALGKEDIAKGVLETAERLKKVYGENLPDPLKFELEVY